MYFNRSQGNTPTIEQSIELAKRAFALRKYEQAVEHYATALELMSVLLNSPLHGPFLNMTRHS